GFFEIFKNFGLVGLIIVLWWMDQKKVYKILDKYKADMIEQRRMYESNVSLVKDYHSIAGDLKDVVIINTQAMTTLSEQIRQNEFCPLQPNCQIPRIRGSGFRGSGFTENLNGEL
ncbi:MAG: hypothetical protein KAT27_06145, partial [Desulfobacterales bacterium]|nr:hypothetical protein [Desulfobacterales bacterium]